MAWQRVHQVPGLAIALFLHLAPRASVLQESVSLPGSRRRHRPATALRASVAGTPRGRLVDFRGRFAVGYNWGGQPTKSRAVRGVMEKRQWAKRRSRI
jgi:hypothetical protein